MHLLSLLNWAILIEDGLKSVGTFIFSKYCNTKSPKQFNIKAKLFNLDPVLPSFLIHIYYGFIFYILSNGVQRVTVRKYTLLDKKVEMGGGGNYFVLHSFSFWDFK